MSDEHARLVVAASFRPTSCVRIGGWGELVVVTLAGVAPWAQVYGVMLLVMRDLIQRSESLGEE